MGILCIICIFFYLGRSWGQEQTFVVFAPKVFCVGASENVVIQVHGYTKPFAVSVAIKSYPDKKFIYSSGKVNLSPENKFQGSANLIIKPTDLPGGPNAISHVYLEVVCAHFSKTTKIPLRYDNGFIFIETDKSIYFSHKDSVKVRAYVLDEDLKPSQRDVALTVINPEGEAVTVMAGNYTNPGIVTFPDFEIPYIPNYGLWTIKVMYTKDFTTTGSTEFAVKDQGQPTFVLIEPESNAISYENLQDFKVNIKAKDVSMADAFVLFGIRENLDDDGKEMLFAGVQTTKLVNGAVQISFNTTKEMKKLNMSLEDLNNKYLNIFVDVQAKPEWETNNGIDVKYSILPYTLELVTTPLFVKPGLPFSLKVQVKNTAGHFAQGVAVILEAKIFDKTQNTYLDIMQSTTNSDGVASFVINIPPAVATLDFHVKTAVPGLPAEYQASNNYQGVVYSSRSQSFLSLSWPDRYKTLLVGKTLSITVTPKSPYADKISHYNYLVSSKGKIIHFGTEKKLPGSSFQLLNLTLTQHMVPTACLLVYYFVKGDQKTEMVSDSVCLKIEQKCDNQLQIHLSPKRDVRFREKHISLTMETQSESWVALSLVDVTEYGSEERRKSTTERILQSSHKHIQDCGAGGGRNNAEVLSSTGLTVLTNVDTDRSKQNGVSFKKTFRSKRELEKKIKFIASTYRHQVIQKCCYDGARESEETCEERSARITYGPACIRAFSSCCKEANEWRLGISHTDTSVGRTIETIRILPMPFPEEHLWNIYHVQKRHQLLLKTPVYRKHWKIQGVGVSNNGLCVIDELRVLVSENHLLVTNKYGTEPKEMNVIRQRNSRT